MKKTNALRILDQSGIDYRLLEYFYDPQDLDVQKIARDNELDVTAVYKTLVVKGDRSGLFVAVVPGHKKLDRKRMAKASGNKKIDLLEVAKLEVHTGYIRGACSPVGMKSSPPVYIDRSAESLGRIWVNAGKRGLLMEVDIRDLVQLTEGKLIEITEP